MDVDVRQLLPHRYPFLLVDRVLSQDGDDFVCLKNVTVNEPFFQGHFPGEPVMPGVLIVEALAQAAAVGLALREGESNGTTGYLAGIQDAKFRRKVVPGDTLHLEGTLRAFRHGLCKADTRARVDGDVVTEAKLSFVYVG
ncbi:MAG: 3-hydroxyacyl-ACP dehydratase FabZ [Trueperaceae bacterium]|nr:3-hydroxyacyl-ACP dehydratase FabZ [Trueperaceae bacterium]